MKTFNTDLPTIIGSYSMNRLINEIELLEDNELLMPWYSFGGDVWAGFGFADFLNGSEKKITAKVTGVAASMGAALLPYFDKVIGAKQADIMLHSVSSSVNSLVKKKNEDLYKVLSSKIDENKFKELKGISLKDVIFAEGEERKDVWITGEEAHKIGLFDELIDLSPSDKYKNEAFISQYKMSANLEYELPDKIKNKIESNLSNQKKKIMNIDELKASHPELYAQVFNKGKSDGLTEGVKSEKNRVDTWMVFNDVNPEKVKNGIESGEIMSEAEKLTFLRESQTKAMQNGLEAESAQDLIPDKETAKVKTEAQKEDASFDTALENAGIEKEDK